MGELTATIAITAEVRDEKESKPAFADLSIFRDGHYLALFRLYIILKPTMLNNTSSSWLVRSSDYSLETLLTRK